MKKTTGQKAFILMLGCLFFVCVHAFSNEKDSTKITVTGLAGIVYEGYRLSAQPESPSFVNARKPGNLVRIIFQPTISMGEFKLPFNFSFSPMQNNFASPPFGFGNLSGFPKQSFSQWITNPVNNIGLNPSYKWIEIPLGTQYIKLSELSTGDVGAFGYGISLKPGKFRLRFFSGVNQQAYEPYIDPTTNATFAGTYKRSFTMAQIGLGREGKYFTGFNIVRGIDDSTSVVAPMVSDSVSTAKPQICFWYSSRIPYFILFGIYVIVSQRFGSGIINFLLFAILLCCYHHFFQMQHFPLYSFWNYRVIINLWKNICQ